MRFVFLQLQFIKNLRIIILVVALFLCAVFGNNALAFDADIRTAQENALDVSLLIKQNRFTLKDEQYSLDTDAIALGFLLIDVPPKLPLQIGLAGGYSFVSQQIPGDAQSIDLGGAYIGILARAELFRSGPLTGKLNLAYTYQASDGNNGDQSAKLRWNHARGEFVLDYRLSEFFSLTLGGIYGNINAKLTVSDEDGSQSFSLQSESNTAGQVGLKYHIPYDQYVGIQYQTGYNDEFLIQFQRTF